VSSLLLHRCPGTCLPGYLLSPEYPPSLRRMGIRNRPPAGSSSPGMVPRCRHG